MSDFTNWRLSKILTIIVLGSLLIFFFSFGLSYVSANIISRISFPDMDDSNRAYWITAIATMSASLPTSITLAFLLFQYKREQVLRKADDKYRDRQDEKRNEYESKRYELIQYEIYQSHKKAFNNLLSSIEQSYGNSFTFSDKDGLYSEIFPKNDFNHIDKKLDMSNLDSCGVFMTNLVSNINIATGHYNSMGKNATKSVSSSVINMSLMINSIFEKLKIIFIKEAENGDVYLTSAVKENFHEENYVFNVYRPAFSIDIANNIVGRLYTFCGDKYELKTNVEKNDISIKVLETLQMLLVINEKERILPRVKFIFYKNELVFLAHAMGFVNNQLHKKQLSIKELDGVANFAQNYQFLISIFTNKKAIDNLSKDRLEFVVSNYREYLKFARKKNIDTKYIDDLINIIK